jgi:glycosyltransferase involved in cell wall biosynthesis
LEPGSGRKMRHDVLHILGTARSEGASIARIVAMLAAKIDPDRYRLHAWFLDGDGPLADELRGHGIPVRVFDWRQGARDLRGAWRVLQALGRERFSIVHQHFGGRSVSLLARQATGAKLILHMWARLNRKRHGFKQHRPKHAEALLVPSRATAGFFSHPRLRVVYPGVELKHYVQCRTPKQVEDGHMIVGAAGRLVPIKGMIDAIRAIALLKAQFPCLRLEIAGAGPERKMLEESVRSLSVADKVSFLGWQPSLAKTMARWDIFLLPSLEEPLPIVGLEAMASGLPVIASAVEGLPEMVQDGTTGLLVPPANPGRLAEGLRTLLVNPHMRCQMAVAGPARVRACFSAGRMATEVAGIYDAILRTGNSLSC